MRRARLLLAFDASSVIGVHAGSLTGSAGASSAERRLPRGALRPGPFDDNVVAADVVRDALAELRQELGVNGRAAALVLPDGCARLALIEPPAGVAAVEYARFRLAPSLPFPPGEALVDGVRSGPHLLAAVVRRRVVQGYEDVVAAAGFRQDRVDVAPLLAAGSLLRKPPGPGGVVVVLSGDAAQTFFGFSDGQLCAARSRRRDADAADEASRVAAEAERTAALLDGTPSRILLAGRQASELATALRALGRDAWAEAPAGVAGWLAEAIA
ncbi:MAG: hypothetical protein AB7O37_21430 [Vicinamibacteria bacterium]